ncbi:MAG: Fe-S cluster assembly protein SufD [Pseudomonadota bacterium]|jgi:Fe-S cluster assembly protein SufD
MNAVVSEACQRYLDDFRQHQDTLPGAHLPWLADLREQAWQRFLSAGFPNLREEDWRYTSVAPIEQGGFTLAPAATAAVDATRIEALALPDAHLLVFVDGRHAPALSRRTALPTGVGISSLAEMLARQPEAIQAPLERVARMKQDDSVFVALNAACMVDGTCIQLAAGARLEAPIQLLFLASTAGLSRHSRNLVLAGADSSATVVEHHAALDAPQHFTTVVTDIVLGRSAKLEHHKLQQESRQGLHIAAIRAELAGDSHFASSSFALGGAMARADIHVALNGAGAGCTLDGLYLGDGRQHLDHHIRVDHRLPQGSSRALYKGVLGRTSRAVFDGKVIVHPGAQQTDASQINRNLLLTEKAEIDTKPRLEIWADDVKCSHGATVGPLDAEQVFYLRSRGLDDASARALLTHAFAAEMVQRVGLASLRERLDGLLHAWAAAAEEAAR